MNEDSAPENRSTALAAVPGIDAVIDGHSHTALPHGQDDRGYSGWVSKDRILIGQAGEYGKNIGLLTIQNHNGYIIKSAKLIQPHEFLPFDKKIIAQIMEMEKAAKANASIIVGESPVLLQGDKTALRTGPSNLADFVADSMLWATDARIAFLSGGSIHGSIEAGDITMGDVLAALSSHQVTSLVVSGATLWQILEHGVAAYPNAAEHYIHVAGLTVTFDPKAEPGKRVTEVRLPNGQWLCPAAAELYTIATLDFIAIGGDGYDMLQPHPDLTHPYLKYHGDNAEILVNYLATDPTLMAATEERVKAIDGSSKFKTCPTPDSPFDQPFIE